MTLTRRVALFIAAALLLALGAALLVQTLAARQAVQQQQDMRNRDTAASLALALSQQAGDPAALQAVAAAQFDLGHYRRIALRGSDGKLLIDLQQAAPEARAPGWFMQALPLATAPGSALVSAGWRELGTLEVEAHTAWAHEALWHACARTAALLSALALVAASLAAALLRLWLQPLATTVAQAQALEQGRFVQAPLPALPELRHLTRSMNTTVGRLREMFAQFALQVAYLQRQSQLDGPTGLPLRQQFMQRLAQALGVPEPLGPALLLARICNLEGLNDRLGRAGTDALLQQVAQAIQELLADDPDASACRLVGGDFALLLPLPGLAGERMPALRARLDALLAPLGATGALAAVDRLTASDADTALLDALVLLDSAEADGQPEWRPRNAVHSGTADFSPWRARIDDALAAQRVKLAEYPVQDARGGLLHLECPLRLQLDPLGEYLPAAHWLSVARRCDRLAALDAAAVRLALYAIALDRRPRAVNIALSSLSDAGFVARVSASLNSAGDAAHQLSIEWMAEARGNDAALAAAAAWAPSGVRLGVEHAGGAPEMLVALRDSGLSFVKVDARHLRGAAGSQAVQAYARSLVGLIHLLGLQAVAEGIDRVEDLAVLWSLGFDGATGSALAPPRRHHRRSRRRRPHPPRRRPNRRRMTCIDWVRG